MDGPLRFRNATDLYQDNWEDPRQLKIDNSAPREQLPYHCRIDWTKEGTEVLKQRSQAYIRSQPNDNTYYTRRLKRPDTGGGGCCTQDRGNDY